MPTLGIIDASIILHSLIALLHCIVFFQHVTRSTTQKAYKNKKDWESSDSQPFLLGRDYWTRTSDLAPPEATQLALNPDENQLITSYCSLMGDFLVDFSLPFD